MKRSHEKELMDLPGLEARLLEEDLRNLRVINRYLGAYRGVLWSLRRLKQPENGRLSLLDVGTGNGDLPRAIAEWARKNRVPLRIVGLEPHPVTVAVATRYTGDFPEIAIVRGDGNHPPFAPGSFDFILASQLLHHFSEDDVVDLLRKWSKLARRGILVSDLVRNRLAYYGISWLTWAFTRNKMTRTDAPLSVRRAFTLAEWKALFRRAGIGEFRLFSFFPFRVLGIFLLEGSR